MLPVNKEGIRRAWLVRQGEHAEGGACWSFGLDEQVEKIRLQTDVHFLNLQHPVRTNTQSESDDAVVGRNLDNLGTNRRMPAIGQPVKVAVDGNDAEDEWEDGEHDGPRAGTEDAGPITCH